MSHNVLSCCPCDVLAVGRAFVEMRRVQRQGLSRYRSCATADAAEAAARLAAPGVPCFANARSVDLRPRIAAQESFDVASSVLPKPPNIAFVNMSIDHEQMHEAAEVVWAALSKQGSTPVMVAQTARQQRFGGRAYVEVLLGHIPDVRSSVFTFDDVPAAVDSHAFLATALIDWRLALDYPRPIAERLHDVSRLVDAAPLVGGVLPPAAPVSREAQSDDDPQSSLFFLNDNVYRGAAACAVLHAPTMAAHVMTQLPSVVLEERVAASGTVDAASGLWTIATLGGERATDVIKAAYQGKLKDWPKSTVFIGIESSGTRVPVAFRGHPDSGSITVSLPHGVAAPNAVDVMCDSPPHDRVGIATGMTDYAENGLKSVASMKEPVVVEREARRSVPVASAAALHWTNSALYEVVQHTDAAFMTIESAGASLEQHAPSLAERCFEHAIPTAGVYCPGQVMPRDGSTSPFVAARAATAVVLHAR